MQRPQIFIEKDYVNELVNARLTLSVFSERLKVKGCRQIVGPDEVTTMEFREDQSRCFVTLDEQNRVIHARFG